MWIASCRVLSVSVALASMFGLACSERTAPAANAGAGQSSPPAAQSDPAAGASSGAAGGYEGFLEAVNCEYLGGWAWNGSQPGSALTIDLYDGDRLFLSVVADQFRQDLVAAHRGTGQHAFRAATPPQLKDGKPHSIRASVKGTSFRLMPLEHAIAPVTCAKP